MEIQQLENCNILVKNNNGEIDNILPFGFVLNHPTESNAILISATPDKDDERAGITIYANEVNKVNERDFSGTNLDLLELLSTEIAFTGNCCGCNDDDTGNEITYLDDGNITLQNDVLSNFYGITPSSVNLTDDPLVGTSLEGSNSYFCHIPDPSSYRYNGTYIESTDLSTDPVVSESYNGTFTVFRFTDLPNSDKKILTMINYSGGERQYYNLYDFSLFSLTNYDALEYFTIFDKVEKTFNYHYTLENSREYVLAALNVNYLNKYAYENWLETGSISPFTSEMREEGAFDLVKFPINV